MLVRKTYVHHIHTFLQSAVAYNVTILKLVINYVG